MAQYPTIHEAFSNLLTGQNLFFKHEDQHPWHKKSFSISSLNPFMRITNKYSGSNPDSRGYRWARGPWSLATHESRKLALELHSNRRNRERTPFISFTDSASGVHKVANTRFHDEEMKLTVIHPIARLKLGLPMIKMVDEQEYYDCELPRDGWSYENEFLCLLAVTPKEVVGCWYWSELRENSNWYEDVIMPKYRQFEREHEGILAPTLIERAFGSISAINYGDSGMAQESDMFQANMKTKIHHRRGSNLSKVSQYILVLVTVPLRKRRRQFNQRKETESRP